MEEKQRSKLSPKILLERKEATEVKRSSNTGSSWLSILFNVPLHIAVAAIVVATLSWIIKSERFNVSDLDFMFNDLRDVIETRTEPPKLSTAIEKKKHEILNYSIPFLLYEDEEWLHDTYNQFFQKPRIEHLVQVKTSRRSGEFDVTLYERFGTKLSREDITELISEFKPAETDPLIMFDWIQEYAIKKGKVILDLELLDVELPQLEEFEELVNMLREKYEIEIPKKTLESQKSILSKKATVRTLSKLEDAKGWVLVEGDFLIEELGDKLQFTYRHPVSNYIANPENSVYIVFEIPKSSIKPKFKSHFMDNIGEPVDFKVFGAIPFPIGRKNKPRNIKIQPLAIYR
ncbi:MAG: hypothetical protein ACUZ77_08275 [Candidatus Brocadiales bacterium]